MASMMSNLPRLRTIPEDEEPSYNSKLSGSGLTSSEFGSQLALGSGFSSISRNSGRNFDSGMGSDLSLSSGSSLSSSEWTSTSSFDSGCSVDEGGSNGRRRRHTPDRTKNLMFHSGANDKVLLRKVKREAVRKGKDIVEASKKTNVKFFCVSANEPNGDMGLLLQAMKAMNEGEGSDIGKMGFSCSENVIAIASYLPRECTKMCRPKEWLHRVATDALGPEYRTFCGSIGEEPVDEKEDMQFAYMSFTIGERDKRLGITTKRVKKIFQQQLFPKPQSQTGGSSQQAKKGALYEGLEDEIAKDAANMAARNANNNNGRVNPNNQPFVRVTPNEGLSSGNAAVAAAPKNLMNFDKLAAKIPAEKCEQEAGCGKRKSPRTSTTSGPLMLPEDVDKQVRADMALMKKVERQQAKQQSGLTSAEKAAIKQHFQEKGQQNKTKSRSLIHV